MNNNISDTSIINGDLLNTQIHFLIWFYWWFLYNHRSIYVLFLAHWLIFWKIYGKIQINVSVLPGVFVWNYRQVQLFFFGVSDLGEFWLLLIFINAKIIEILKELLWVGALFIQIENKGITGFGIFIVILLSDWRFFRANRKRGLSLSSLPVGSPWNCLANDT